MQFPPHDPARDLAQRQLVAPGIGADAFEGLVDGQISGERHHALRLLDDDTAAEGDAKLLREQLGLPARALMEDPDGGHVRESAGGDQHLFGQRAFLRPIKFRVPMVCSLSRSGSAWIDANPCASAAMRKESQPGAVASDGTRMGEPVRKQSMQGPDWADNWSTSTRWLASLVEATSSSSSVSSASRIPAAVTPSTSRQASTRVCRSSTTS